MEIFIVLASLVVIIILIIAIMLLLANLGAYFTKIAQGTTAFINVGDSLKAILPNIGGYKMSEADDIDGRSWLIPEKNEEKRLEAFFHNSTNGTVRFQKWLWKTFGIKFISWIWPHTNVHKFDIRKGGRRRIEASNELKEDAPLRSRVVDSDESTIVNSLLFLVPRPVYLEGVELAGDNSRINLLLLPIYRQVIPSLPVYYLKGDFFTLLDAAIESIVVDFFAKYRDEDKPLDYNGWLKLPKAGGDSPLEKHIRNLNVSKSYLEKMKEDVGKKELTDYIESDLIPGEALDISKDISSDKISGMIPSGIVPRFGFALVSFRIVKWEPHKSTVALAEALLAKETQLRVAEGVREESYGVRDSLKAKAEGESSRYNQLMDALVGKGVNPNGAAEVLRTQIRTENIGGSGITTYVEGGASASVMVTPPPESPKSNKEV